MFESRARAVGNGYGVAAGGSRSSAPSGTVGRRRDWLESYHVASGSTPAELRSLKGHFNALDSVPVSSTA